MIVNIDDYICPKCKKGYEFDTSKEYSNICTECGTTLKFLANYDVDTERKSEKVEEMRQGQYWQYMTKQPMVTCPYCQSSDTKKITNTSKALHTAVFGIWSMGRNSKNYHCNECGSDF